MITIVEVSVGIKKGKGKRKYNLRKPTNIIMVNSIAVIEKIVPDMTFFHLISDYLFLLVCVLHNHQQLSLVVSIVKQEDIE
jgi:hypothetical protein